MPGRSLLRRGIRFARAAVALACVAFSAPLWANSPAPPWPDPWFTIWPQIKASSLPPGVKLKLASNPYRDYEYFVNSSRTPFYLVTKPKTPPRWVRELPSNVVPHLMSVSGRVYELGSWSRAWKRMPWSGIPIGGSLRPTSHKGVSLLRMDVYLGSKKITIRGRYITDPVWHDPARLELGTLLPAKIRLVKSGSGFAFLNEGPLPLYTAHVYSKPQGWITEVPFGYLAIYKLVAGKAYWAIHVDRSSPPDGWTPDSEEAAVLDEFMLTNYVPGLKFRQIRRDHRPRHVRPPAPQPLNITAFYGKRKVVLRGRILYDLNPNYDPLRHHRMMTCGYCNDEACEKRCAKFWSEKRPHKKPPSHPVTY